MWDRYIIVRDLNKIIDFCSVPRVLFPVLVIKEEESHQQTANVDSFD